MLTIVSPAKSLDYSSPVKTKKHTEPTFLNEAEQLIGKLRTLKPADLSSLMNISDALAQENFHRYESWERPFNLKNARQAIYAFKGDVYLGLKAEEFGAADLNFAQKHLRILSGLYGLLRPLDLMQAYRLEMGRQFGVNGSKNLYEFWGSKITKALDIELDNQAYKRKVLINLASNEYFSSVKSKTLDAEIITPQFRDWARGEFRVLSFFAKKARGEMAAFIIKERINSPCKLKEFNIDGYRFSKEESSDTKLVFKRKRAA
jgi:uncharacterized protein